MFRRYQALEAGELGIGFDLCERIVEVRGWPGGSRRFPRTAHPLDTRRYVCMSPLPFTGTRPRGSQTNWLRISS
jgi:hypothetical protein